MKKNIFLFALVLLFFQTALKAEEIDYVEIKSGEEVSVDSSQSESNVYQDANSFIADEDSVDQILRDEFEDPFHFMEQIKNKMFATQASHFQQSHQSTNPFSSIGLFSQDDYSYEEVDNKIVLFCHLPGLVKGNYEINFSEDQVVLTGSVESQVDSDFGSSYSSRSFFRNFPLHQDADTSKYDVELVDGGIIISFDKKGNDK